MGNWLHSKLAADLSRFQSLFIFQALPSTGGIGFFDVGLVSLENQDGRLANGRCCTGAADTSTNDSTKCPGICATIMRVCLLAYRPGGDIPSIADKRDCSYGYNASENILDGSDSSSFRLAQNRPDLTASVKFTFIWPVSLFCIFSTFSRHWGGSLNIFGFIRSNDFSNFSLGRSRRSALSTEPSEESNRGG